MDDAIRLQAKLRCGHLERGSAPGEIGDAHAHVAHERGGVDQGEQAIAIQRIEDARRAASACREDNSEYVTRHDRNNEYEQMDGPTQGTISAAGSAVLREITFLAVLASLLCPYTAAAQNGRLLVTVIADGAGPVQDAQVRVYQYTGPGFKETLVARGKTTESGRVTITVPPGKAYKVRISHPAYGGPHEVDIHPPAGDIAVPVRLYGFGPALEPASAEIAKDVRGVLRGQVLSSSGEPLSGILVRAKATGPNTAAEYHAVTREDGSYRLAVRPGRYSVEAGASQFPSPPFKTAPIFITYERTQSEVVPVERGYATTVNLSLPPAFVMYNLTVSLIDGSNQPVDKRTSPCSAGVRHDRVYPSPAS